MDIDQHDFHGILHSALLVENHLRAQLEPLGIRPRQARFLDGLSRMAPVSQVRLAKSLGVTSASMSTMTDRLLAAGLISRETDPKTRRRNVLTLTIEGQEKLKGISDAWSSVDAVVKAALGENRAAQIFELSRELRAGLGGHVPGQASDDKS